MHVLLSAFIEVLIASFLSFNVECYHVIFSETSLLCLFITFSFYYYSIQDMHTYHFDEQYSMHIVPLWCNCKQIMSAHMRVFMEHESFFCEAVN